jgi:para-aminobenzoate synthetase/4-amino-4-deoxychorismate lyase
MEAMRRPDPQEFRRRAATEWGSVLLEDGCADRTRRGQSYFFADPVEVVTARTLADLPMLFEQVERARRDGLWAAGYVSYECGYHWEPTAAPAFGPGAKDLPLAVFGLYREPESFTAEGRECTDHSRVALAKADWQFEASEAAFTANVEAIRDWIAAGDTYQVNLTARFATEHAAPPEALFSQMMAAQPVAFGALLHLVGGEGAAHILSVSPELFFRQEGRAITVRPMKGTAARGRDTAEDAARMAELGRDEKNRAENLMIVDLLRSDLGRIAELGTVQVKTLFDVERLSTLLQMSSEISATLRPGVSAYQMFGALFPCGSIVGAPKVRTMQILRRLEARTRGVYTGAIGYFAPDTGDGGRAVFSVAIRTAVVRDTHAEMGVGAGITYSSDPAAEYAECRLKADFLREEPFELIETMRVENGGCALLDRHLARLGASAAYFDFSYAEEAVRAAIEAQCALLAREHAWRLRMTLDRCGTIHFGLPQAVVPDDAPLEVMLWPEPVQTQDRFLRHKTTRRALYDRAIAEARAQGCVDAIFLNEHGQVAEGAIHSVIVRHGDRWRTPTLDAGVLPGIFRAHLLATMPTLQEADFGLGELLEADEIRLINAVRGARVVTLRAASADHARMLS